MSDQLTLSRSLAPEAVEGFVTALYRIFLAREPDEGGFSHYSGELQGGMLPEELVRIFSSSEEYLERMRRKALVDLSALRNVSGSSASNEELTSVGPYPEDYAPPGEAGRSYLKRLRSGFLARYCSGTLILDVGFSGYDNPDKKTALPGAIGVDLDYPGYDGVTLPFGDRTVDCVFSSHCLEHITFDHAAIRDWYRVLRVGGFIVCMVPSQALYEKQRFLPSRFNADHKRMYTPSSLARVFEESLDVNSYRVRHLAENDDNFDYSLGPDIHSDGAYEIEIVIEKIVPPQWQLA